MRTHFPLKKPNPNFEELKRVLKGEKRPERVHPIEIGVDNEVIEYISEKIMGKKLFYRESDQIRCEKIAMFKEHRSIIIPSTQEEERAYYRQYINFYYQMGYDYFPDHVFYRYIAPLTLPKVRTAKDTAPLPRKGGYHDITKVEGSREWAEEGVGVISSWEEFERFPWDKIRFNLDPHFDFLNKTVPEGMKAMVCGSLYEDVLDKLLGQEHLFYLLYDDPRLIQEVSSKWGNIVYNFYSDVLSREVVGGIWHGDDLGHKTGTMINPDALRKIFFPWLKKYASLAHEHDKMFWLHSCGNILKIMKDLIEDIDIDAFHSFQDGIIPVEEFKEQYGDKIAVLGGVDLDKLIRLNENSLREYVERILDRCMSGGRYALGSGNTIANYVPVKNYLIMLEEGAQWENRRGVI